MDELLTAVSGLELVNGYLKIQAAGVPARERIFSGRDFSIFLNIFNRQKALNISFGITKKIEPKLCEEIQESESECLDFNINTVYLLQDRMTGRR